MKGKLFKRKKGQSSFIALLGLGLAVGFALFLVKMLDNIKLKLT